MFHNFEDQRSARKLAGQSQGNRRAISALSRGASIQSMEEIITHPKLKYPEGFGESLVENMNDEGGQRVKTEEGYVDQSIF